VKLACAVRGFLLVADAIVLSLLLLTEKLSMGAFADWVIGVVDGACCKALLTYAGF